jgi:CRISPR system Cascade subunit CasB
MTSTEDTPKTRTRALSEFGRAVDKRVKQLQNQYLREHAAGRAALARLRRGLGKNPGDVPEIWDMTMTVVPESWRWNRDEPSRAEHSAHNALTLYAVHQQSMRTPAHIPGKSFGVAVGTLRASGRWSEEAITRRFMAVATAESASEALFHMRGLVTQLRTEQLGFDYAVLADDLVRLLTPGRAVGVRLAWGRDFYRTPAKTDKTEGFEKEEATA